MSKIHHPADFSDSSLERQLTASRLLEDAPEHVIHRALAVFQPNRKTDAAPSLLQRILAVVTFDSGAASPLAFGMRSAGGTTRQMLFSAEGHDVDLRISPADESRGAAGSAEWVLAGQVLGPEAEGAVIVSDGSGLETARVALNDMGEFRLPAVSSGDYTVTLKLGQIEIVLPAVQVPQAA
jgi:hypothetical protein